MLYLLQAIPIKLPPSFFASFKTICRTFLWASHSPRLGWDRLVLPKQKGGIGLPDLSLYHRACQLARIVDWHVHKCNKDWVLVENAFSQTPVSHLPWIEPRSVPKPCSNHPLIGPTLFNFRVSCRSLIMIPSPGPMTPLTQNPDFPPNTPTLDHTAPSRLYDMSTSLFQQWCTPFSFRDGLQIF